MFTLVVGIIFLLFKFSLRYNDIYYYYNVTLGSRFLIIISEFQFLVTKYFLMVTCCRKVLTITFRRFRESVKVRCSSEPPSRSYREFGANSCG